MKGSGLPIWYMSIYPQVCHKGRQTKKFYPGVKSYILFENLRNYRNPDCFSNFTVHDSVHIPWPTYNAFSPNYKHTLNDPQVITSLAREAGNSVSPPPSLTRQLYSRSTYSRNTHEYTVIQITQTGSLSEQSNGSELARWTNARQLGKGNSVVDVYDTLRI